MTADSTVNTRRRTRLWVLGLLVFAAVAFAAWRLLGDELNPGAARPSQSESLTPTQAVLQRVGLQTSDLLPGESAVLAPKGNKLIAPSLSFCTGEFPSESKRLVRRLTQSWSSEVGVGRVSTDVVQYESVEAAAEALEEVRVELAVCSAETVPTEVTELEITGKELLPGALAAVLAVVSDSGVSRTANLWQVRGNVLVILSARVSTAEQTNSSELIEFWKIGEAMAKRLAALDAVEVGYF